MSIIELILVSILGGLIGYFSISIVFFIFKNIINGIFIMFEWHKNRKIYKLELKIIKLKSNINIYDRIIQETGSLTTKDLFYYMIAKEKLSLYDFIYEFKLAKLKG